VVQAPALEPAVFFNLLQIFNVTYDIETLNKLDSTKLMDIVKNYRQYGLEETVKVNSIAILGERGISTEELAMGGTLSNHTYDLADELYRSFNRNSKISMIAYTLLVTLNVLYPILFGNTGEFYLAFRIIAIVTAIVYIVHLLRSFMNQDRFYKIAGDNYGANGAVIYFLFGLPFYIFAFFLFRSQMKDKMKEIN
jgi:hypothetical protein